MAYSVTWPSTLPQKPNTDFNGDFGVRVASSPMDKGAPKRRYLGKRLNMQNCTFNMSITQVNTLKSFIADTLLGTKRFGFPDPLTNTMLEVRIVPQEDGKFFTFSYITNNYLSVTLAFEVLP